MLVQLAGLLVVLAAFASAGVQLLKEGRRARSRVLLGLLVSVLAIFAYAVGVEVYRGCGHRLGSCEAPAGRTCHENTCQCVPRPLTDFNCGEIDDGCQGPPRNLGSCTAPGAICIHGRCQTPQDGGFGWFSVRFCSPALLLIARQLLLVAARHNAL